jgi:hypothetical protein
MKMMVLNYGKAFVRVGDIKEDFNFFPQLYSWGKNEAYFFRLRRIKEGETTQIQDEHSLLPILELSEYEAYGILGGEDYEEYIHKVLKFYLIQGTEGVNIAIFRDYDNYDYEDEGTLFMLEASTDGVEYQPLKKLRLKSNEFVALFENGQMGYFLIEGYKQGWYIRFI